MEMQFILWDLETAFTNVNEINFTRQIITGTDIK
jgi:hypothetical protein